MHRFHPFIRIPAMLLFIAVAGCAESAPDSHNGKHEPGHHQTTGAAHASHGHAGHEEPSLVQLSPHEIKSFDIQTRTATSGHIALTRTLPGEVVLNPTKVAHVTPRVPGVVLEVRAGVGDRVEQGEVLAVLRSRELARAKSAYLAALSKLQLARAEFQRAANLWEQNLIARAEYLAAREARDQARVAMRLAKRELHALGLSHQQIARLKDHPSRHLGRYVLKAPISGEVIHRHLVQGEVVPENPSEPPFVIAGLDQVRVELTVYPGNLGDIEPGQKVVITARDGQLRATSTIAYVSPLVDDQTRTATARVVLDNSQGHWKPGLFVTARVRTERVSADVVVPASALHVRNGETIVFVQTPDGFKPQPVTVGPGNGERVAIVSGLEPGQTYVADNGFIIKAELLKGTFSGHSH